MSMVPESLPGEHRLHPFSWLFVLITQLREVALPLIVLLLFGSGAWWEFLAIGGALVLAAYSLVYSLGFRYRIGDDELTVREGIFDRTERHIPLARIQNIARRSNLLHRAFGVTELRLESGGGLRPEAVMKVLRVAEADALVALLRAKRTVEPVSVAEEMHPSLAEAESLLHLPLAELVRFGLVSNRGMVVVAGALAAFWQFSPDDPRSFMRLPTRWAAQWFNDLTAQHVGLLSMVLGGAVLLLLAFALLRLLSVLLAIVIHYDFRLERDGDRLGAGGGLLTHAQGSARIDRLQMLHIQVSVLHRLLKRMSLKTDVAGGVRAADDRSGKLHWLAPIARPEQVDTVLGRIVDAPPLAALPWRPLHARAWRRRARWPIVFWLLISGIAAFWFGALGLIALLGVPWSVVAARGWARFTGYAMDDRFLAFREGWWSRRYALIALDKLQAVEFRQSPFDRRHQMASVSIDSMAADPLGSGITIPYLPVASARVLFAVLSRRCARSG